MSRNDEIESLTEAAMHWKSAYEIEATKRVEEIRFLEYYFAEDWSNVQRALRAHMMSINL